MIFILCAVASLLALVRLSSQQEQYVFPASTLPPTPTLPTPVVSGYVNLSTVDIWYAQFGPTLNSTKAQAISPIVFIHGGFANSNYLANQVSALLDAKTPATLISIDSRLQGRSTGIDQPISYDLMREDVVQVLDHFGIPKATLVGWSDGGIIGLDMAVNAPERIDRLFAFAGQYDYTGLNATINDAPVWQDYTNRVEGEYESLSPTPDRFDTLSQKLNDMFATMPNYNQSDFARIPTLFQDCLNNPFIWIVDAADEEAINRDVPTTMHNWIPGSGQFILPSVSHFA